MKTSNKLLFSASSGAILAIGVFMISVKKHVNFIEGKEKIIGNKEITEVIKSINLDGKTLNLNHNFTYTLDGSRTELYINAESNLQPYIEKKVSVNEVEIDFDKTEIYELNLPVEVIIGVKDYNYLNINVDDHSKLVSNGVIECNTLTLQCEKSSKTDIDIDCDKLVLTLENRAEVTISGRVEEIKLVSEDYSRLHGDHLYADKAFVEMEDKSYAAINIIESLGGVITDSAKISHNSLAKRVKVSVMKDAKISKIKE